MRYFDSTGDTTTTNGSGSLVGLSVAPTGYRIPTAAGVANGDVTVVRIQNSDNTTWEICESTLTVVSGVVTYSRGTLIASSTGSRVSFLPGTKNIYFTISQQDMGFDKILVDSSGEIMVDSNFKVMIGS